MVPRAHVHLISNSKYLARPFLSKSSILHRPVVSPRCEELGVAADPVVRERHGYGHTLSEMYDIKYSAQGLKRIPDVVVYPSTTDEVSRVVAFALAHNAVVLSFGGGTNITQVLVCPPEEVRAIISVDMSRMNSILWLNEFANMASVQAGAVGQHLKQALNELGWTVCYDWLPSFLI